MDECGPNDRNEPRALNQPKKRRNTKIDLDNLDKRGARKLLKGIKDACTSQIPLLPRPEQPNVLCYAQPAQPDFSTSDLPPILTPPTPPAPSIFCDSHSADDWEEENQNFHDAESKPLFLDEHYVHADAIVDDEEFFEEHDQFNDLNFQEQPSNSALYDGAEFNLQTVMIAILSFVMAHKISARCLKDLLQLIKLILPKKNNLVGSLYFFFKYFEDFQSSATRHYYCRNCKKPLDSKDTVCDTCDPGSEVDYFINVSVIKQLQNLFQQPGFYEKLSYPTNRVKQNENGYEDIYDGQTYKDAKREHNGFLHWITFLWNTDGFSLFKSSSFEIWPVFLSINELPPWLRFKKEYILLGGLWFGRGKPDSNLFLKPLFDELNLLKNGVLFNVAGFVNQILYKAGLLAGTCDAPAKACFLVLTNFNGLFGCPKCLSRGEKSERTGNVFCHLFQENLTLRTEANYLNHLDRLRGLRGNNPNHKAVMGIRGPTILKNMLISSLIRSTSLDVMHCVFLGTMKTLMLLWFTDSWKNEVYSLFERKDVVSHLLSSIKPPHCIERVPQSLDKLKFWKASEFMSFFYYYSLPVFHLVMRQLHFNHFKLFFFGISLLSKSSVSDEDITLAQSLLDTFVKHFGRHYGNRRMAFNLHTIRHLPSVVRELGPLWTTSCFSFENLNGSLKYLVHGTQHAGLQIQNNFELLTQLPNHLNNLAPGSLKEFSLEMLSAHARLRVTERIESGICIVGSIRQNGKTTYFQKLKMGNILYVSQAAKPTKKDSSFVSYGVENSVQRGIIQTFEKVQNCECNTPCNCPAESFAIVNRLDCVVAFRTLYPPIDIDSTYQYTVSNTIDRVPIKNILGLCVNVVVENQRYITDFVNKNFFQ